MSTNKKTLIDGDFQVGSNHFVVDTENNYVGFNNVAPQNKIDVQIGTRTGTHSTGKPLYVTGVTNTSGAEFVSDDGTTGTGIGSSNIFTTGANQNLTIAPDGTGAVGIKTATPNPSGETFDLWVQGDTKITGNVTVNEIFGDGSGLTNVPGTQWVSSSEDIYFLNNTGSGEGKVGIGKTAPEYKLDILDSDKPTIRVKSTSTDDGDALLILDSSATGESDIDFKHDGILNWRIRTGDASANGTTFQINDANDSDVLTIQQNGNVGIGTNSPNVPLEVNKSAGGEMFRLTTSTGTLYAGADANPPWFGTSSDDHLRLMTNGTEKVRIESGGNVGIGTTNPDKRIHVRSLSNAILTGLDIETTSGSSGNDEYVGLGFGATSGSQSNRIFKGGIFFERKGGDTGRGDLLFCVENTQDNTTEVSPANAAMRINRFGLVSMTSGLNVFGNATFDTDTLFVDVSANRVGIGTDAPGAKLDVSGNVRVSTPSSYNPALQLGTQTSYNDDQLYSLRWGGSTLMGMGLHSSTRGVFGKQGLAIHIPNTEEFSVKTNDWTNLFAVDGATRQAYFGGTTTIANGDSSYTYYGPNSTWSSYLLTGSGTNQIGTRSDLAQVLSTNGNLHLDAGVSREIYMNYYAGRDIYFGNGASGTNGIMKQDGSLGLGTTSPGYKLEVNGTSLFGGEMRWSLGHTSHAGYSTNKDWYIRSGSSSGKVIIQDTGGNVGIGTSGPGYKLDVNGDIRATGNVIAFSDRRAKSNIEKIENSLEKIRKINGYTYTMRVKDKDQRFTGLIAQEVLEILPEAVMGSEENHYSLAYGNMAGLFVEAIKELTRKNELLETQLGSALARLDFIERKNLST